MCPSHVFKRCIPTRQPNGVLNTLQMAQASARHIANHPSWGRLRNEFICRMLLSQDRYSGASIGCRSLFVEMRQVEPLHAPLLIEDTSIDVLARAQPYAMSVV
jgi:hypothetical protein